VSRRKGTGLSEKAAKLDNSRATIEILSAGDGAGIESLRERNHCFAKYMPEPVVSGIGFARFDLFCASHLSSGFVYTLPDRKAEHPAFFASRMSQMSILSVAAADAWLSKYGTLFGIFRGRIKVKA